MANSLGGKSDTLIEYVLPLGHTCLSDNSVSATSHQKLLIKLIKSLAVYQVQQTCINLLYKGCHSAKFYTFIFIFLNVYLCTIYILIY